MCLDRKFVRNQWCICVAKIFTTWIAHKSSLLHTCAKIWITQAGRNEPLQIQYKLLNDIAAIPAVMSESHAQGPSIKIQPILPAYFGNEVWGMALTERTWHLIYRWIVIKRLKLRCVYVGGEFYRWGRLGAKCELRAFRSWNWLKRVVPTIASFVDWVPKRWASSGPKKQRRINCTLFKIHQCFT